MKPDSTGVTDDVINGEFSEPPAVPCSTLTIRQSGIATQSTDLDYFFTLNSITYRRLSRRRPPPHGTSWPRSNEMSIKESENKEILQKRLSDRQLRANRTNAQKSTGPRTAEGKQRSRLNGLRHGLTGQVSIMTDENRAAHDAFCNPIIARLKADGPL